MKFILIEDENKKKRVAWNKGLTKDTNDSVAKYAKALTKERPSWQLEVDDDGKMNSKYRNKRTDASSRGIEFNLSFEQYCKLAKDAGIMSSQIGTSRDKYQLARIGDSGPYSIDNCRFILQLDNARERKVSELSRENSRKNAAIMNSKRPEDIGNRISNSLKTSEKNQARLQRQADRKAERRAQMNPSYTREKNSQFGTYWAHNKETGEAIKWSDKKGPLPDGFERGRKSNK